MPGAGVLADAVGAALQYGIIVLLYYFLYRMVRMMRADLAEAGAAARLAPAAGARLRVAAAAQADLAAVFLIDAELRLGRGGDNDVALADTYVSHRHARIFQWGERYGIEDLASSNHTYVNGEILRGKTYLQDGDIIKIGLTTFKFER